MWNSIVVAELVFSTLLGLSTLVIPYIARKRSIN